MLPSQVQKELSSPDAPAVVRLWIGNAPPWLEIQDVRNLSLESELDAGEAAAIALAESLRADLILIDERSAAHFARSRGLHVTGTLGVLDLAATRGLVDFRRAIRDLTDTNFRISKGVLHALMAKHGGM